jgi:Rrf2 family protein
MSTNLRFAISIHALTLLATSDDPLTSEAIAMSVDTNPVVVRRAMASLREHGLVESKSGAHGGWKLLRKPGEIGLCEVYRCLGENSVLAIHSHPNRHCRVGANIKGALTEVFVSAQREMEEALAQYTVQDILDDVLARADK